MHTEVLSRFFFCLGFPLLFLKMKSFFCLLLLVNYVSSVCYCPVRCVDKNCAYYDTVTCNDIESRDECNAANAEVTDMVNSMGKNADLFLLIAGEKGSITAEQASRLRTHLSSAFEDTNAKPVGDCQAGLSTDTRIEKTNSHCFSPTLLGECQRISDATSTYSQTIHERLSSEITKDASNLGGLTITTPIVADFIKSMKARGAIASAKVKCASFLETTSELASAGQLVPSLFLSVFAVLALF
eukprot:TRINITY_DN9952_c0_g2_i1.p1 TRINITY_DN9952_c0_g2~~TRINITY_DN9952_c0_g2_i1.p1  ORF type:complete len:242 (+),score=62.48 TRINITY_DN9952_c0_g2_i1:45-770(+)